MTLLAPVVSDDTRLGLRNVLANSLPIALGSPGAPGRYTVEAVFTRRPSRDEIAMITGGVLRDALVAAGYPRIELTIADRRLQISDTNIAELNAGLAQLIADQIADMSDMILALRADNAAAAARSSEEQLARAAAIVTLAASVSFATSRPSGGTTGTDAPST